MLSTILQLIGFASLVAAATLFGLLAGVQIGVACGLVALAASLVLVGLAAGPAKR